MSGGPRSRCRVLSTVIAWIGLYLVPSVVGVTLVVTLGIGVLPYLLGAEVLQVILASIGGVRLHQDAECTLFGGANLVGMSMVWMVVGIFSGMAVSSKGGGTLFEHVALYSLFSPIFFLVIGAASGYIHVRSAGDSVGLKLYKGISFFLYWIFLGAPFLIEVCITGVSGKGTELTLITLLVCGSILTVLGAFGGAHLIYQLQTRSRDEVWNHSPLDLRNMATGAYLTYSLPLWVITNFIATRMNRDYIPWYTNLLSCTPVVLYGLAIPAILVVRWILYGSGPERRPLLN